MPWLDVIMPAVVDVSGSVAASGLPRQAVPFPRRPARRATLTRDHRTEWPMPQAGPGAWRDLYRAKNPACAQPSSYGASKSGWIRICRIRQTPSWR